MLRLFILVALFVSLVSCTLKKPQQNISVAEFKQCSESRPQICTREYMPVCATRDTGIRCVTTPCPSSEQKTYGNSCEACADTKVLGFQPNDCEQKKNRKSE